MTPTKNGSIHLFRFAGVDLYLHWSWFLLALYGISNPIHQYSSITWNVLEYLSLFVIVLLHEFGHALACRQVGGRADQIVLWPLGGVAYVDPPARPGATLWSIAAGPLVNVALLPILTMLMMATDSPGSQLGAFFHSVWLINIVLLVFNLLPIFPLDGGQIVRCLLWFLVGRGRSLMIASIIGLAGVAAMVGLALLAKSIWFGVLSVFILLNCWRGLMQARILSRLDRAPRHEGFACPACKQSPPHGLFWRCGNCHQMFDPFASHATCPNCGAQYSVTFCTHCGAWNPIHNWALNQPTPAGVDAPRI